MSPCGRKKGGAANKVAEHFELLLLHMPHVGSPQDVTARQHSHLRSLRQASERLPGSVTPALPAPPVASNSQGSGRRALDSCRSEVLWIGCLDY